MNSRKNKIIRGVTLAAALALFVGVVTLFAAPNVVTIVGTIFDGIFELGPGTDEGGVTNVRNDGVVGDGPDWSILSTAADGIFNSYGLVNGTTSRVADIY